jgi:hypothetical protein
MSATPAHDYDRYAGGCRCKTCRAAKAEYMRTRRAAKAQQRREHEAATGRPYVAEGITHGITGFQEHGCRCFTCRLADSHSYMRREARRRAGTLGRRVMALGGAS